MRRDDCMEMFERIPEDMHAQVNLVLRNRFVLSVGTVARFEDTYVVFSGREGGTSDEGRGFFVPYDEISYIRIERPLRVGALKSMYGETGYEDMEDRLDAQTAAAEQAKPSTEKPASPSAPTPAPTPAPVTVGGGADPASIAKQNLLDRIRAARANVAGTTGRLGSGGK